MVSIKQIRSQIKRDASAYDKLVHSYNALVQKERKAGKLVPNRYGKVNVTNTAAGKAAGKRVVLAWNKVARKGQRLKADLELFAKCEMQTKKNSKARTSAMKHRR